MPALADLKLPRISLRERPSGASSRRKNAKPPTKRNINLAAVQKKKLSVWLIVPMAALAAVAVITAGRVMVADRLGELYELRRETSHLRRQLEEGNAKIAEYDGLEEVYAHYTWDDMTPEEKSWPDYVEAMDLLERAVLTKMTLDSWDLKGNQLRLSINGRTLQEINQLAKELNADPLVDYCSVTTAAIGGPITSSENIQTVEMVSADIVIYMRPAERW